MAEKNYRAFTGLTGFYYKTLGDEEGVQAVTDPERIKYLQEISVSKEQSIEKAYGDNVPAELAVASGTTEVEATFHKLPLEDRVNLYGLHQTEEGAVFVGESTPPYTACIFQKTMEDGSSEYVGLFKGIFTLPEISGNTKEDGVEFSQDQSNAEFMPVEVEGIDGMQSYVLGHDPKGSTKMRDYIWEKVFGAKPTEDDLVTSEPAGETPNEDLGA
ncbi:major tail protein [Staphylococcus cohnii]